jgi:hypothetical protein
MTHKMAELAKFFAIISIHGSRMVWSGKVKHSRKKNSEEERNLRFPPLHLKFGTITRLPHFTPKAIIWYTFLPEAAWKPTKKFHGPYRESNPELPVLWRSASTNCSTARHGSPPQFIAGNKKYLFAATSLGRLSTPALRMRHHVTSFGSKQHI